MSKDPGLQLAARQTAVSSKTKRDNREATTNVDTANYNNLVQCRWESKSMSATMHALIYKTETYSSLIYNTEIYSALIYRALNALRSKKSQFQTQTASCYDDDTQDHLLLILLTITERKTTVKLKYKKYCVGNWCPAIAIVWGATDVQKLHSVCKKKPGLKLRVMMK